MINPKKKLLLNTITPIILEFVTIACGFILPRIILTHFGSEVNGLVSSIGQFLGIIAFMEAGVGSVIRFNLFKPLHEHDEDQVSRIVVSANKFFRRIAAILLCYAILLMIFYPMFAGQQFGHLYTAFLIAAMVVSSLAQYYFGQVNQLLLTADQNGYIQYTAQILTVILNTVACVIMINLGASIHIVKLTTSLIYLLRPLFLNWYVKHHYNIDYRIKYSEEPIKQKWNGLAQHISAVVLADTDVIVLTLFSSLSNVSIYSVYNMITNGIKKLISTGTSGIDAFMGHVIAGDDKKRIEFTFSLTEWAIHTIAVYLFGCTIVLIVPFVSVYTYGVKDTDYIVPLFAVLICIANMGHSLRLPYSITILDAGHYKQTQRCYIVGALLNIIISVALVVQFGLIGVAIGTIVAMFYQTIWVGIYCYKNILGRKLRYFIKQISIDAVTIALIVVLTLWLKLTEFNYLAWVIMAVECCVISVGIVSLINLIFYRENIKCLFRSISKKRR